MVSRTRHRQFVCLLLGAFAFLLPAPPARAQGTAEFILFPTDVQPNGTFYLAGAGFPANQDLNVYLFCKDPWFSAFGHWKWTLPAQKIRYGSFTSWKMESPTPFTRDKVQCTLTAGDGVNPYGVTARINIWPADESIPVPRLPVTVQMSRRVKGTMRQVVTLKSTPGAHVVISAYYPRHSRPVQKKVVIPWSGQKKITLTMPADTVRGDRVQILVRGYLGKYQSRTTRMKFGAVLGPRAR